MTAPQIDPRREGRAPSDGRKGFPSRRCEVLLLIGLIGAALLLRWMRWENTALLFNDGPAFLGIARSMAAGDWSAALAHPFHPLYSLLTVLVHPLFSGWEAAAASVSILSGGAAVLFLYLFLRSAFGWQTAALGAALLAAHARAAAYSSDVQSDGLYLALFLAGLWLLWRALRIPSPGRAAWAGAASGLAYLTRPEGLGLAMVGAALAGTRRLRGEWTWGRSTRWVGALAAGAAVFLLPYTGALRVETGVWQLTQKKSLSRLMGFPAAVAPVTPAPSPHAGNAEGPVSAPVLRHASDATPTGRSLAATAGQLFRTFRSAARYEVLVLLLPGLWVSRGRPGPRGELVLAIGLLYGAALFALLSTHGYVSRRHILPPLVASFGYAALGVSVLGNWLLAGLRRIFPLPRTGYREAVAVGLSLALVVALGSQFKPRRRGELAERRAAEWLRAHAAVAEPVAAYRSRIAYYAASPFVSLREVSADDPVSDLEARGARYVIVSEERMQGELKLGDRPGLRMLHRERAAGKGACVLELAGRSAEEGVRPPALP